MQRDEEMYEPRQLLAAVLGSAARSHQSWSLRLALAALCICYACERSDSQPAEPESPAPTAGPALEVELREAPSDFPSEHVRAALAWVDGRPLDEAETTGPDDLRELRFEVTSDVAVRASMPLHARIPIEPVEPMRYQWLGFLTQPDALDRFGAVDSDRSVSSLPQAEVVLYFDANHNQQLDLIAPGMPGPGPDRILAVGSGRETNGTAVRNVVVNKRAPLEPPLELFVQDWGAAQGREGLFLVRMSVGPELPLAQEALLSTHGITSSSTFDKYWARDFALHEFQYRVEALDAGPPIPLFPVTKERQSWLAHGCVPYPTGRLGYAKPPPPGAAVQCGADVLSYASHPDDYCGQSDTLSRSRWQASGEHSDWPCDERGLSADTPYVAANQRLSTSALSIHNGKAYTGVADYRPPASFRCRPDILYDFDADLQTHLPALPPPANSQVKCYGRDALSFIPNDPDCQRKFTYDLSSDSIPGYSQPGATHWDLRAKPPAWWPCDADGNLIPQGRYRAPEPPQDAGECPEAQALAPLGGEYPPPPHSLIRCTSASSLVAVPLWSDHCDGRTETALSGDPQTTPTPMAAWKQDAPEGWPCDASGQFIPMEGYAPL